MRAAAGGAGVSVAGRAAGARLMIEPGVTVAGEGTLARALTGVERGSHVLLIENSGLIRSGTQGLASLYGTELTVSGRALGTLRNGVLFEAESGLAVGRLRAAIPQAGVELQLVNGGVVTTVRPMLVDVLELTQGRYLVRLASGETAWVTTGIAALGLTAAMESAECEPNSGAGLFVRTSGEAIEFDSCEALDGAYLLRSGDELLAIAASERADISYGSFARELATSQGNSANEA